MKSQMMFAVFLLGIIAIKADDAAEAAVENLVKQGAGVYDDVLGNLKGGVKNLYIAEELTKFATSFAKLDMTMNAEEKEGFHDILQINVDAQLAIDSSRVVVSNLKNALDTLKMILDFFPDKEGLRDAIQTYVDETARINPDIEKAKERLSTVFAQSIKVDAAIEKIKKVVKRKQEETNEKINNMSEDEIAKERAKAYGGAAACLAWGPLAIFTCPIAYGIAGGVTEGKTVADILKDVNAKFDDTRNHMETVKTNINAVGEKTKELVSKVEEDKTKLEAIQTQMNDTAGKGRGVIKFISSRMFDRFFTVFKTLVTDLMSKCDNYLAEDKSDPTFKLA